MAHHSQVLTYGLLGDDFAVFDGEPVNGEDIHALPRRSDTSEATAIEHSLGHATVRPLLLHLCHDGIALCDTANPSPTMTVAAIRFMSVLSTPAQQGPTAAQSTIVRLNGEACARSRRSWANGPIGPSSSSADLGVNVSTPVKKRFLTWMHSRSSRACRAGISAAISAPALFRRTLHRL